jgi:hypothetical protein
MTKSKPTSRSSKPKSSVPSSSAPTTTAAPKPPALHKQCSLTLTTIHRAQIQPWPGEPLHELTIHARARLKASIRRSGLVLPLPWNKQTGHLIDGIQRLALLDELASPNTQHDYDLQVIALDLTRDAELRLALTLNNPSAMSAWHIPGLESVVRELAGDISATAFDPIELQVLCDSDEMAGIFADSKDRHKTTAQELAAMKQRREDAKKKLQEKAQLDLAQKYHDGRKVAELIHPDLIPPTPRDHLPR